MSSISVLILERKILPGGLIRKKLEAGKLVGLLADRIETNGQFIAGQQKLLEENAGALDSLRQKAEVFAARTAVTPAAGNIDESVFGGRCLAVGDDEIEIAFLREKSRRNSS